MPAATERPRNMMTTVTKYGNQTVLVIAQQMLEEKLNALQT